jgi:hypothetical protein
MKTEDLQAAIDLIAGDAIRSKLGEGVSPEFISAAFDLLGSIAINMQRQADALELVAQHLAPIITAREETPEERAAREGWVKWNGEKEFPDIPNSTPVEVRLRDRDETYYGRAAEFVWGWSKIQNDGDIVAYRVVT